MEKSQGSWVFKKSCSLKKRLVVCSFEIYQPVVTIYSFTKTIVGKKAEREVVSPQLSPGTREIWQSQSRVEMPGVTESQRYMLSLKLEEEGSREERRVSMLTERWLAQGTGHSSSSKEINCETNEA